MPETVATSHFPSFYKFSPDDVGFTCIHPCKTNGFQRCKNPVRRRDRVAAADLRTRLSSLAVEEGQLVQSLGRYAELCCCIRSHRNDAKELGLFRKVISEWLAELDRHKAQVKEAEAPATAAGQRTSARSSSSNFSTLSTGGKSDFAALDERQGRTDSFESVSRKKDFPEQPSDQVVLGPVTRSRAQETAEFNYALSKPPRFIPYKSRLQNEVLDLAVPLPLTFAQSGNGTLYMFKRKEDPGFLKLGYTTQVADDRFAWIERSCGYSPMPIRQIRNVSCIKRVERLVHIELMQHRRKNTTCLDNPDCRAVHAEWFEVDETIAMAVMDRWVKWMVEAEPYGADGRLTKEWMQICLNLKAKSELPTSANLLEAMRTLHERQVSRHLTASALSVGKHLVDVFSKLEITTKCLDLKPFEQQEQAGEIKDPGSQTSSGDVPIAVDPHVPTSQETLPTASLHLVVEVGTLGPMTTQLGLRPRISPLVPVRSPT